jgi:HSP20 family protein
MFRPSPFDELFNVFRDFDTIFRRTFSDVAPGVPEMSRLLPSATGPGSSLAPMASARWAGWNYLPAVESYTKDGKLFVRAELPGVDPADLQVTLTGNKLQIMGEKKATREVNETDVHFREIAQGRFERNFTLPEGIRSEQLKARFDNGVLELSIPVPEESQPRKIQIDIAGAKQIKAA